MTIRAHLMGFLSLITLFCLHAQAASISPSSLSMSVGQIASVTVNRVRGNLSISNSDPSVAEAELAGVRVTDSIRPDRSTIRVTALKAGKTNITVRDRDGRKTLEVRVTASSTSMSVSPTSISVGAGQSANVTVSNASGSVQASSSNSGVASATVSGNTVNVRGVAAGSATITVRDSNTSRTVSVIVLSQPTPPPPVSSSYSLLAWNDLGMHCVDGKDYSVFSILPPYNNLHAHLINRTAPGNKQVTAGVTLTYESFRDAQGSINTFSAGKTNFWNWVVNLFGAGIQPNYGLNLNPAGPSNPTAMWFNGSLTAASGAGAKLTYNGTQGWWEADGIPIMPYADDKDVNGNFVKNFYPMVKVTAWDGSGNELASAKVVLPVSDEMTCKACHASNSGLAAQPSAGWVNDPDPEKDWKKNILRLHDEKHPDAIAVAGKSADYAGYGNTLLQAATVGKPSLCAGCHKSNALQTPQIGNIKPLTEALHGKHANVIDPVKQMPLDAINNRDSCYLCHPGSVTKCLRGVMGNNPDIDCQSCHGNMSLVGQHGREGWLDEPNCQSCHDKKPTSLQFTRYTSVFSNGTTPRAIQDTSGRFATNPNTPAQGVSLYRFSKGHGGLQCESCHGSTHAIYPSSHDNDNLQSIELQGHAGTVAECNVCHANVPNTTSGGPHGVHTVGQAWVSESAHGNAAERNSGQCTTCHGSDYRGSPLSKASMARTLSVEGRTKVFPAGHQFGCYDCHNGPRGGD